MPDTLATPRPPALLSPRLTTPTPRPAGGRPHPLLRSLIAYWPLNEASGGIFDPWRGNNSGATIGAPTRRAGRHGTLARDLRGSVTDGWTIPSNQSIVLPKSSFSAACWANLDTLSVGSEADFFKKGTIGGSNYEWALEVFPSSPYFQMFVSNNGTSVNSVTSGSFVATTGVWYCLICWYDLQRQQIGMAINGTEFTIAYTNVIFTGTAALGIGCTPIGTLGVDGALQDAALWARALTPQERRLFYNNGYGLPWPWRN